MDQAEQWADVPSYIGFYMVSDRGRVYNLRRLKIIKGSITKKVYRQVNLYFPGRRPRCYLIDSLVLHAFISPRPDGYICDHKNGNRSDNSLANLEWVTPLESVRRAISRGRAPATPPRGEQHVLCKLSRERVQAIRTRHHRGANLSDLAREYRVTPSTIWKVVNRVTWRHVE